MTEPVAQTSAPEAAPQVTSAPVETAPAVVSSTPVTPVVETADVETVSTVLGAEDTPVIETTAEKEPAAVDIKPVEVKTEPVIESAEKTQPDGEKKEEASQSDEPAPLPSYEPWKFPEGMTVDPAQLTEVNKMFSEFEQMSKADHALVQKFGQQIIDRHVESVQAVIKQLTEAYQESWKKQTKDWYDAYDKDPEIGGSKKEASGAAAREFIRRHGGTPEQQTELRTLMEKTGIGNHPAVIRAFAKATANLSEGKVIPAGTPPSAPTTLKSRFYGAKK